MKVWKMNVYVFTHVHYKLCNYKNCPNSFKETIIQPRLTTFFKILNITKYTSLRIQVQDSWFVSF